MKNEWLLGRPFDTLPFVKIIGTSLKVFWLLQGERSRTGDVESQLMVREIYFYLSPIDNPNQRFAYGKEDLGSLNVEDHDLTGGRIDIFSCPWPLFSRNYELSSKETHSLALMKHLRRRP